MKRIAILTYHKAYNCGAMLQAWALKTFLETNGFSVVFPDCNSVGVSPRWSFDGLDHFHGFGRVRQFIWLLVWNICSIGFWDFTRFCYRRFARREFGALKCRPQELDRVCDAAVIGSDQVWHPLISKKDTPLFLAENVPQSLPVIAYAASFGDEVPERGATARIVKALPRFRALSVREELAERELREAGFAAKVVLDPTFLLKASSYRPLVASRPRRGRYLFLYAVSLSHFVVETARELARRHGLELVICGVYVKSPFRAPSECVWGVSPEKMVTWIAHAEMVLASSFHGTALAVIFSKQFLSLRDAEDSHPTRISTLLDHIGLSDRIANPSISAEQMQESLTRPICWTAVHAKLRELRGGSARFLMEALNT